MLSLSCRLFLVFFLATASLASGASIRMNSAPAQAQAPSSPSSTSPTAAAENSAGSGDGYQLTSQAFQQRVVKARELIELLHRIHAEAKARVPGNPSKQQTYFLAQLNEKFPGSTYDGKQGKIIFQKNFEATFNNTMNVDSIAETGEITGRYLLEQGQIQITYGTNSVTAVIDRSNPALSRFTNVVIPAMRVQAETVLSIPGYRRVTSDSVETSIVNDAYQLLSQTNALRMDHFAADLMRSPKLQKRALSIAGSGYLERHPQEYQRGEQAAAATKTTDRSSRLKTGDVTRLLVRLVLVVFLSLGVFWGARRLILAVQMSFLDKVTRQYVKKYHALSPMVMRSLGRLGRSLWGINLPWSRKYYLTKRSDRWTLSDRKIDRLDPQNQPDNLVEVCLRDNNFKIRISRMRGVACDMTVTSSGYAKRELREHLLNLRSALTQAQTASGNTAAMSAGEG